MAISYNAGTLKSSDITASTSSAGVGQAPDRRRLYNFGDRVAELAPEESPFFVYLSKVSKSPTDDSVFRFLENRNRINWTDRSFVMSNTPGTVVAGSSYTFNVSDADTPATPISWLLKGMVFVVQSAARDEDNGIGHIVVRVESSVVNDGAATSSVFTGKVIDLSNSGVTGYNVVTDNDVCQVIGTSFEEGSGSPDVFSTELEDGFGYTQIFKTAAEMTNTAYASKHRG